MFTKDDWSKLKSNLNKTDIIELWSGEKMDTDWKFYRMTNLTLFAVLLKDVTMGCIDAVLPNSLLVNHTITCLIYEENTRQPFEDILCLFRLFPLHLHETKKLEEEPLEILTLSINKMDWLSPGQFHGVQFNDTPNVEDLLLINVLYDIDVVEGSLLENYVWRDTRILCDYWETTTIYVKWVL